MNTHRPHDELDADERELARVVRALPGSDPSPALDLRILKAAQDAVAPSSVSRKRRVLWASSSAGSFWGFGTAAAAVLAVGVSWQMFMRGPTANFPATRPAVIADDKAKDRDVTSVDYVSSAAPAANNQFAAPAADNQLAAGPAGQLKAQEQAPAAAAIAEPMRQKEDKLEADAPKPFLDEHVADAVEKQADTEQAKTLSNVEVTGSRISAGRAATADKPAANQPYENDLRADAGAARATAGVNEPVVSSAAVAAESPAPLPAPAAPPAAETERREEAALAKSASAGVLGGNAAPADQSAVEPPENARNRIRLDARLYPESWILKIRSRLRHGDVAGARASLKLFVEKYPNETVPTNLKPLLGE